MKEKALNEIPVFFYKKNRAYFKPKSFYHLLCEIQCHLIRNTNSFEVSFTCPPTTVLLLIMQSL